MWEWDRAIVHPLAREALDRSVREQAEAAGVSPDRAGQVAEAGRSLLDRYVAWAPVVDDFVPIRVETDFEVPLPDPTDPARDLVTPDGEPVHYRGRIDLLVVDGDDNYWIVEHRPAGGDWTDTDVLVVDQRSASFCWAWEQFFLGMRIAGVIFNELRAGEAPVPAGPAPAGAATAAVAEVRHRRMYVEAARAPSGAVTQHEDRYFRRTRVPKSRAELEVLRRQMAHEALDMVSPGLRTYPNPSPDNCGPCGYRAPCLAESTGADPATLLDSDEFRDGPGDDVVEGRLGGVSWSMGRGAAPPRFGAQRRMGQDRDKEERA